MGVVRKRDRQERFAQSLSCDVADKARHAACVWRTVRRRRGVSVSGGSVAVRGGSVSGRNRTDRLLTREDCGQRLQDAVNEVMSRLQCCVVSALVCVRGRSRRRPLSCTNLLLAIIPGPWLL